MNASDAHPVDPGLRELVTGLSIDFDEGLDSVREDLHSRAVERVSTIDRTGITIAEAHAGTGSDGSRVRLVIVTPDALPAPRPAILSIHGGGYVTGSTESTLAGDIDLARHLDAVVVSVDYRLAPEHRFPVPLNDCEAGLRWIFDNAKEFGVDRTRVAVSGQSAGGGLAAALALRWRASEKPALSLLHLTYPMLDDRTGDSIDPPEFMGRSVWTRANNRFGWQSLLGDLYGSPNVPPEAAPARAADLAGMPPTFIACGGLDLFLHEDLDFAQRLMSSGTPVELHVYPHTTHSFAGVRTSRPARALFERSVAAYRHAFGSEDHDCDDRTGGDRMSDHRRAPERHL